MSNLIGYGLDATIVRLYKALHDVAPGYTYLTAMQAQSKVAAGAGTTAEQNVAHFMASTFKTLTNAQFADLVVANMHLTGEAKTQATAFANAVLSTGAARGDLLLIAVNYLPTLENDAVFGAAAKYINESNAAAYQYSINEANTSVNMTVLGAADEPVSGITLNLTTSVDNLVGTAGDDTINGLFDSTNKTTNLTALDKIDGGAGNDKLVVADLDGGSTIPASATVTNVEELVWTAAGAVSLNTTSNFTGLTKTTVSATGDATVTGGSAEALTVASTGGSIDVNGGASHVISASGLNEDVTSGTAGTAAHDAKGNVSITHSKQGSGEITVTGGKDVTVTASNVTGGSIYVGDGTQVATGAIVVSKTGAAYDATAGSDTITGDLEIIGGTSVTVTQTAFANRDAAADDTSVSTRTLGAISIDGAGTATTVTVTQDRERTARNYTKAVTGVADTQTVTFGAMTKGETLSIEGLTFTAVKDLTAAQVANAFANLSAGALQGYAPASQGIYSGTLSATFKSGAVATDKVLFTESTASTAFTAVTIGGTAATPATTTKTSDGVTKVTGVTARVGVTSGAVAITDSGATDKVATVSLTGFGAGSTINSNALKSLTLAGSDSDVTVTNGTANSALALTVDSLGWYNSNAALTLDANYTSLSIDAAVESYLDLTASGVKTLTVSGADYLDLSGGAMAALETVTLSGDASVDLADSSATLKSVTSTSTGNLKATVDGAKATVTTGAGADSITTAVSAGITKAISLGAGNDTLTLMTGTTGSTAVLDGGDGTDTLSMAAADAASLSSGAAFAAQITGFEKVKLGAVAAGATVAVDMSNLDNINHVISSNTGGSVLGSTETAAITFTALTSGQTVTAGGLMVTANGADLTAAQVAAAMSAGATIGNAAVSGSLSGWTAGAASGASVTFTAATAGNVANITTSLTNLAAPTVAAPTTTQGVTGVTESSAVTFVGLIAGESVTVTGTGATTRVVTATPVTESATVTFTDVTTAGSNLTITVAGLTLTLDDTGGPNLYTASDIASVIAGGTVAGITTAGSLTNYSAAAVAGVVTFTSTVPATNMTDIAVTGTAYGTQPVATVTQGSNGNLTAAQVAAAMSAGSTIGAAVVTNSLTGFTAGAASGNSVTFTSSSANTAVTDIAVSTTAGTNPAVATNQGVTAVTEISDVTMPALKSGQSVTVAGRVVTATGGDLTAVQVESAMVTGTSSGNAVVSGVLAGFNATTNVAADGVVRFTSTSAGTPVTDVTYSSGAATAATALTVTTTDGGVGAATASLTLNKFVDGGTLEMIAAGAGATVSLVDAKGTTNSLNLTVKNAGSINVGTIDAAGVETINLKLVDGDLTDITTPTHTVTLKDAALSKLVVTGDANVTLALDANVVALTSLDASALVGKLTASTNGTVAQTIIGSAKNDTLTAKGQGDVLNGGAGNDTLIVQGNLVTLTGGAGNDVFNVSMATSNSNNYATITDASAGDMIKFAGSAATFTTTALTLDATAVFQDYANHAIKTTDTGAVVWFQFGGNTYIVQNISDSTSFVNGSDIVVKLTGLVDLSTSSFSSTHDTALVIAPVAG